MNIVAVISVAVSLLVFAAVLYLVIVELQSLRWQNGKILELLIRIERNTKHIMSTQATNQQALADLTAIAEDIDAKVQIVIDTDADIAAALKTLEDELAANGSAGPPISPTAIENVVGRLTAARDKIASMAQTLATQKTSLQQDAANQAGTPTPPVIVVTILPKPALVAVGGTQQFSATVQNDSANAGVTWSVRPGGAGGTIDSTGLYTAPAVAGVDTVDAESVTDQLKGDSVQVTVA